MSEESSRKRGFADASAASDFDDADEDRRKRGRVYKDGIPSGGTERAEPMEEDGNEESGSNSVHGRQSSFVVSSGCRGQH